MTAYLATRRRLRRAAHDDRGSVTVWTIGATAACILILGLVVDGGTMLRARSDAFALAAASARAGAQQLDGDAAVEGRPVLDPNAARQAALDYLAAHDATGTVTVTAESITVTVTSHADLQLLRVAGSGTTTFNATSTVNVVKVDNP